jgi:hypothetical protein
MGHERIGSLPRTQRWRTVVDRIASVGLTSEGAAQLADLTINNVRRRFEGLADDNTVQAAFHFLLALPLASRSSQPNETLERSFGITLADQPTPLALVKAFHQLLNGFANSERSDLAAKALADTVAQYTDNPKFNQSYLFETTQWDAWREADTAAGFCNLSRLYFSNLTERYLRYYLDREASAMLETPERVIDFRLRLKTTVDSISQHAFETSKITQSFAAGWFQKNAKVGMPRASEIRNFLSFALHKMREELRREAGNQ